MFGSIRLQNKCCLLVVVFPLSLVPSTWLLCNHPKLGGVDDSHFIMLRDSLDQEFREGIVNMIYLCTMISEASAGRTRTVG